MSYNSNKAYRSSVSYSFSYSFSGASEYTITPNQTGYSNKTAISYSGNPNSRYNASFFSNDDRSGNSLGSNGDYMAVNASGRSMGKGGGRGAGRGKGKGMGGRGAGKGGSKGGSSRGGGRGMGQECIKMQDQFREDQKNKFQSDETELAINNIQQTDLDVKIQKNHLDIMIEKIKKLEEKSKKRSKQKYKHVRGNGV